MSVLSKYFDKKLNQKSPVIKTFDRVVRYDEDGNELVTWEEVDTVKRQKSLGKVEDWSLNNLLKAGINPNFPIHTGYGTRLEGLGDISDFEKVADDILSQTDNQPKVEE